MKKFFPYILSFLGGMLALAVVCCSLHAYRLSPSKDAVKKEVSDSATGSVMTEDVIKSTKWALLSVPELGFEMQMPEEWRNAIEAPRMGKDFTTENPFWQDVVGVMHSRSTSEFYLELQVKKSQLSSEEYASYLHYSDADPINGYEILTEPHQGYINYTENNDRFGFSDQIVIKVGDLYYNFLIVGLPEGKNGDESKKIAYKVRDLWHESIKSFRAIPITSNE